MLRRLTPSTALFSKLLFFVITIASVSCESGDGELSCDTYYLTEARYDKKSITRNVYYNDDSMIALVKTDDAGRFTWEEFSYNSQRQLIEVSELNEERAVISYDDVGRVDSFHVFKWNGDFSYKSKSYYGADGKPSRQEFFQEDNQIYAHRTISYPSSNIVKVEYHWLGLGGIPETIHVYTYTTDNNKRPFRDEYYLYKSLTAADIAFPHNPVSIIVQRSIGITLNYSYTIETNNGGYPKSDGEFVYTYSCEPVKP